MDAKKLKAKMVENGVSVEQTAEAIKVSRSTLYRQLCNNGKNLTIGNCILISKFLQLTKDEVNEIFFANLFA